MTAIAELLSPLQRQMLSELSRATRGDEYDGQENKDLDEAIKQIQRKSPEKFHSKETLETRQFFNEPGPHIKHKSYVHKAPDDVWEGWKKSWDKESRDITKGSKHEPED